MAVTFVVKNGDIVMSPTSGQPQLVGNATGLNDPVQAKAKATADMQRCLSLSRINDGTGAGISELRGVAPGVNGAAMSVLLARQVRAMFAAILRKQQKSAVYRPLSEQFASITLLRVYTSPGDYTTYRFRVDTTTKTGITVTQAGKLVGG